MKFIINKFLDWWLMSEHKYNLEQTNKFIELNHEKTNNIRQQISAVESRYGWNKNPTKTLQTPTSKNPKAGYKDFKSKLKKK